MTLGFRQCPTCFALPLQVNGGPVRHRHKPGCLVGRDERQACRECSLPREDGYLLCADCRGRVVATIDKRAEAPTPPVDLAPLVAALTGGMKALLAEVAGLRADLQSVRQLADAALRAHPSRPAPKGPTAPTTGWATTLEAPRPDSVRRVELD